LLGEIPVVGDEHVEHSEGVHWLIHWDHVACIVNSEEVKVSVLAHLSSCLSVNGPVCILSSVELFLAGPLGGKRPGFSSSPVADPVLVS